MKRGFLLIVFFFLGSSLLFSQWSKVYGIESNSEKTQNILSLNDGFIVIGSSNTTELWLLKTDLNGDTLWTKKYSETLLYRPEASIYKNGDNGFFLTFNQGSNYTNSPSWIYSLDSTGEIIWKKEIENNLDIIHLSDNGFLALGNDNNTLSFKKISETGNFIFEKYFVDKNIILDSKVFLKSTNNNKFFITITNASSQSNSLTVIEVNSNGDSLWSSSFEDIFPYNVYFNKITNGDIFITGNSGRGDYGLTGRSYLLKIDSTGNEINREFGNSYLGYQISTQDSSFIIIPTFSKTIIKTNAEHNLIWENNLTDKLELIYDPMFMCFTESNSILFFGIDKKYGQILFNLDSDGKLLWQKFLKNDSLSWVDCHAVISLPNNEYIVSGSTFESDSYSATDIKIIKFLAPTKIELLLYPINEETSFRDSLNVKITSNIFDSDIYYTLDGTEPTIQSFHYTSPIFIDSNVVIKAVGYASGYENSDIISKEYKGHHKINVELSESYTGVDSNFTGSALVNIQIPKPTSYLGDATSVKWLLNNNIIGEGENLNYSFQTGTNLLILETTDIADNVQYDTTKVSIYSSRHMNTNDINSSYSQFIQKNQVAQFNSGNFILYRYNYDKQYSTILDSTCSVLSEKANPRMFLSACIIDDTTHLSSYWGSYALAKFINPITNNWSINTVKIDRTEKILTSVSYLADSLVFVGTLSGKIYCNNLAFPDIISWDYDCGDTIKTDIVISEKKDIIFGCANNYLYSLSSNGSLNWKYNVGSDFESTPALGTDSSIIFGANNYKLYKLSNEGTKIWEFETNGKITSSPVIDFYGNIYFGSNDGYIYSVNSKGELIWKYFLGVDEDISASIGNNGLIYVTNGNNTMYVFDKLGETKWQFEVEIGKISIDSFREYIYEEIATAPLITKTNLILLETTFGNIYIIKENPEYHITEKLPQWSTFKGSNQRTGITAYNPTTSVKDINTELPANYSLSQNYPNPFNPTTNINYSLSRSGLVKLKVYDVLGREVANLVNKKQARGNYKVEFNAKDLTSGIYFYRLKSGGFTETKKLILLR